MTEEEFRSDMLATAASRADVHACSLREAFVEEVLNRLRDAGEVPDAEPCSETLTGQRGRRLELDAFSFDEADDSLHLFAAIRDGGDAMPSTLSLSEARDQGFNRLLGFFEQSRDGWLTKNTEESRPLWSLARRIETSSLPSAIRLHVLTDRMISERIREIPSDQTREGVIVTFQIWDISRLKRIHDAQNVRDDLEVDFSSLPGGGLTVLSAGQGGDDYEAYLAVVPGDALAAIYVKHGSRILEGNVRTFLGRRGGVNKGIAATLVKEPARFFAYNNGIAATASAITTIRGPGDAVVMSGATDLQIVNGAQTTASLAALQRDGKIALDGVFVPMKLSVVRPSVAAELIPKISQYANSQNRIRESDFFANHEFHRRMEEISRRVLAPMVNGSQIQTHWFYERARGQYLNEQVGLSAGRQAQFGRMNPRNQVFTKTDLAKVENCFDLLPDIASKGAEKSFTEFADRITAEWEEERKRATYSDDWFRSAVGRIILFRATEAIVSKASWYEGGYRAQIVAYASARLAALANSESGGGGLDYLRIWSGQCVGEVLERQILHIAEAMMKVLRSPPQAGQNISEWAKQQACRKVALDSPVTALDGLDSFLIEKDEKRSAVRGQRGTQRVTEGLAAVTEAIAFGAESWRAVRTFARDRKLISRDDDMALSIAGAIPKQIPTDKQAERLRAILQRCKSAGLPDVTPSQKNG